MGCASFSPFSLDNDKRSQITVSSLHGCGAEQDLCLLFISGEMDSVSLLPPG